jgi:hypothetical protein
MIGRWSAGRGPATILGTIIVVGVVGLATGFLLGASTRDDAQNEPATIAPAIHLRADTIQAVPALHAIAPLPLPHLNQQHADSTPGNSTSTPPAISSNEAPVTVPTVTTAPRSQEKSSALSSSGENGLHQASGGGT